MGAKNSLYLIFACITLLVVVIFAFYLGHFAISFGEFMDVLGYWIGLKDEVEGADFRQNTMVIFEIRLPRIVAAILIGASLSVSGAVFQGMFVNPLVSPGILGVLSGASFGAALGMLLGASLLGVQVSAFVFGCVAVLFALAISRLYGTKNSILMLVLGGVISSSLFGALLSLIKYIADPYDTLPSIVYWLMGSLSIVSLENVLLLAPWMVVSIFILTLLGKYINVLSLGEEDALSLGVDVKKVQFIIIFLATLLSALSVMLAGVIGWIGLVVPHIARFLVGANHLILIPFCALIGSSFLLIADTLSRGIFPTEIPLGILTSLIGIPVFIGVLKYGVKRG